MSIRDYLRDIAPTLLFRLAGGMILGLILFSVGNSLKTIGILMLSGFTWLIIYDVIQFKLRKQKYHALLATAEKLERKVLIAEVIDPPRNTAALPYYLLLKIARKSMLEEITAIKNNRKEYKEYIEQWVHEIKTPISAIKLSAENHKSETTRYILSELESVERYVDQALFYARSEHVEHDYLIKEVSLEVCVHACLVKNKQMFIQNGISVELEELDKTVYTDKKWTEFVINQLLMNAIQYRNERSACLKIKTEVIPNGVKLIIEDNGVGIAAHELPRVFEKGFTGSNGRKVQKSTGIGLYLCRKLCEKLGLTIYIESVEGLYTRVSLLFPKGRLNKF